MIEENYAPVAITVYDRLEHLKQCIEGLQRCAGAKDTVVYIASDAASSSEDEENVALVRDYLKSIAGFREVVLVLREFNVGPYENGPLLIEEIYQKYDCLIRMEDDVVVGQGFLEYINHGLRLYRDSKEVIAVCSYLPPGIYNANNQSFFLNRMSPYGFGRWRDKDYEVEKKMNKEFFTECFKCFEFFRDYEKVSPHVTRSLPLMLYGDKKYRDIMLGIVMQSVGHLALFPPQSISKTIGNDGSGVHAPKNRLLNEQVVFDGEVLWGGEVTPSLNNDMTVKIASHRRSGMSMVVNYIIYILFIKTGRLYPLYCGVRKVFKMIK